MTLVIDDLDTVQVDVLSRSELDAAFHAWDALYHVDDSATPFNSPAWARAWLQHWCEVDPWILVARRESSPIALAPFIHSRTRGFRVLSMLGKEPGDYWELVCDPRYRLEGTAAIARTLIDRANDWDLGVVSCLPPGSVTGSEFAHAGVRVVRREAVECPGLELPDKFDDYLASLPGSRRSNLRRHLRRLDDGEVELEVVTDPESFEDVLNEWHNMRLRQWAQRGKTITQLHTQSHFPALLASALSEMVPAGNALVWRFHKENRVAGIFINFCDANTFYWYLGAFEPDLAKIGVGKIAIAAGIRASIESGRQYFDFTRGSDTYKYWFGATNRPIDSLLLGNQRVKSRFVLNCAKAVAARRDGTGPKSLNS